MAKEMTSSTIDKTVKSQAIAEAKKQRRSLSFIIEEALKVYLKQTKTK